MGALNDRAQQARLQLSQLLRAEGEVDLIEASLLIAAEEYPDLEVRRESARVHIVCAEGARLVDRYSNTFERLEALRDYFFVELGFRGNRDSYSDPRNCYLNEVLNRRLGIPLTLSILFMELARAAGFGVRGVGLPGHFVVRLQHGERTLLVDPFHAGQIVTQDDCQQLVARTTGRPSLFDPTMLDGTDERAAIGRLLLNLKHAYVRKDDYPRALQAVERLLLVKPDNPKEVRDRGLIKAQIGRPVGAISDLETYLRAAPDADDADSVRGRIVWLRRQLSEAN